VERIARLTEYRITYSRHGQRVAEAAGVPCRYMPLGVETRVFQPMDKGQARAEMGLPEGSFVAAMVAANQALPARKAFAENMQAFARFAKERPELEARLYIHTEPTRAAGGLDLHKLAAALGIANRVLFPQRYQYMIGLPEKIMAGIYSAADVLLNASTGEGFGIPIVEAQACGCPVITTTFSAMPELTINGICTEPVQRTWSALDAWQATPSVEAIYQAMVTIADRGLLERRRWAEVGTRFVRENFEWDRVVGQYWKPFLEEVESEQGR
jgi:glycosyltransferase involved in cell wall biosynthesis